MKETDSRLNFEIANRERLDTNTTRRVIAEMERTDPELLGTPETRVIVEVGARFIHGVTKLYGTPDAPLWSRGDEEATIMTYHNGESHDSHGHTSFGPAGAGVPRNTLRIASAINRTTGRNTMSARPRARMFAAGAAHDIVQLCGRSYDLMRSSDGTDKRGDELESAQLLYDTLFAAGSATEDCEYAALDVIATMFDPTKKAQDIDYTQPFEVVLEQEITACADLLGMLLPRGARGTVEWAIEECGLSTRDRVLQKHMAANGVHQGQLTNMVDVLSFIDRTPDLREIFLASIHGHSSFAESFMFSDLAIRQVCGKRMDQLFPGRVATVTNLRDFAANSAKQPLVTAWQTLCAAT